MLLEAQDLTKTFEVGAGLFRAGAKVRAVGGVSFAIPEGKTFALVGESGSGKSTIVKMILGLETPTSGALRFGGESLIGMNRTQTRAFRRQSQAVFQDPATSLNPRHKVSLLISEPLIEQKTLSRAAIRARVEELLDIVGLPRTAADLYPHEFSGGQRQRIAIARALSVNPRFLVLDEPISALDVSIRAQILNLLSDLQTQFNLTYLIVAHDLALVEHFADEVGVMYLGEMVERGPTAQVFSQPQHPYTAALLASVPRPDPDNPPDINAMSGEIPSPLNPPSGCKFHTRCRHAFGPCTTTPPRPHPLPGGQVAACHLLERAAPRQSA